MKNAYTFTVLRYVHDVVTGEALNVGVLLYSGKTGFLEARIRTTYGRLSHAFPEIQKSSFKDITHFLERKISGYARRLQRDPSLSFDDRTAKDIGVSFLPVDDSSYQWSENQFGVSHDLRKEVEYLFERYVMYSERTSSHRRSDEELWRAARPDFDMFEVTSHLVPTIIKTEDDEYEFKNAWKNGTWHCIEPVSFDLSSDESIREKAHRWLGTATSLRSSADPFELYLIVGRPIDKDLRGSFEKAVNILNKIETKKKIVFEDEVKDFARDIAGKIRAH